MDSKQMVDALLEVDPGFEQLCKTLFGDLVEPANVWDFMYAQDGLSRHVPVVKAQPDPADVHAQYVKGSKRMRGTLRAVEAARIGIPVAAGGGALVGTGYLLGKRRNKKTAPVRRYDAEGVHVLKAGNGVLVEKGWFGSKKKEAPQEPQWRMIGPPTSKVRKPGMVRLPDGSYTYEVDDSGRPIKPKKSVKKSDAIDVVWEGTFSKTDDEKRQAFGWASVVEVNGKPIIDRQGDWITPDEIEKAAYNYVLHNRKGGHQHKRTEDDQPLHASDLIESFVVTPEKVEKMGLPSDFPLGWWTGFYFHDDQAWEDVKKGLKTGFSIHGKGKRRDIE